MGLNTPCPKHGSLHPDFLCPDQSCCQYQKGMVDGPDYCKLGESICVLELGEPCEEIECMKRELMDAEFDIQYHKEAEG